MMRILYLHYDLTLFVLLENSIVYCGSLESLQQIGQSLPLVQVAVSNVELFTEIKWMGSEKQHAKLIVTDGDVSTGGLVECGEASAIRSV